MADLFLDYMTPIIAKEGGDKYTDDPTDRGGKTKWGVTEATARAAGYGGRMQDLTLEQALAIYRLFFWTQPGFDQIAALSPALGVLMLDLGVNCNPMVPSKHLQRTLNVLNRQGADWPDLAVDGHCGAATRYALRQLKIVRGEEGERVVIALMRAMAGVRYVEIAEADPTQEKYEYGWLRTRAFAIGA